MIWVFVHSGETHGPDVGILAEIGSFQMEYAYLAHATGKREHFYKVRARMRTRVRR